MTQKQNIFIVLGMHRSGTSALAGTLHATGMDIGNHPIENDESNPTGYWEHKKISMLNEHALELLGSSWHDDRNLPDQWWLLPEMQTIKEGIEETIKTDFKSANSWLIKDPRICRLFPLWKSIIDHQHYNPYIIIVLRDPSEVAKSIARRDNISEERACLLWLQYILDAEKWSRSYVRTFITYDELLLDSRSSLNKIFNALSFNTLPNGNESITKAARFIDKELRHHSADSSAKSEFCLLAQRLYNSLKVESSSPYVEELADEIKNNIDDKINLLYPWASELQHVSKSLRDLQAESSRTISQLKFQAKKEAAKLEQSNAERDSWHKNVTDMKSTFSWKVSAPIRVISNLFQKR